MIKLLNGAHVLVTRPAHQAENLARLIEERGGEAVRFPTLAIAPLEDEAGAIRHTLAHLDRYQWLIFISANAVTMHGYYSDDVKIKQFKLAQIAAMGKATAQALAEAKLPVDLTPENGYNSEALLAMPQLQEMRGQNCLIIRGEGGREELAETLRDRGAHVDYLNVYKRIAPKTDSSRVNFLLAQDKLDAVTLTSGDALQNLLIMLEEKHHRQLFGLPLVAVSTRIGQIAADMGFKRIAVTDSPSDAAILETVTMCVTGVIEWPN